MKKIALVLALVLAALVIAFFALNSYIYSEKQADPADTATTTPPSVLSFEDCASAGYPVMESYPRRCNTPDGRTYAEEIPVQATYMNASTDRIVVDLPFPGAVTGKKFSVTGKARGNWYFEASFPLEVRDASGTLIASGYAEAQSDWMTMEFVPFVAQIEVPETFIGPATLILRNDNPSGLPENAASVSFPITIEY